MHPKMGRGRTGLQRPSAVPRARQWGALMGSAVLLAACHHAPGRASQAIDAANVRAAQARDLARQAGLAPDVQSFLGRAAGAGAATYTAVYDLGSGQRSIVIQRPPDRRVDLQGVGGPARLDRYLFLPSGTFSCQRDQRAWTCQRGGDTPAAGAFTADTIGQTVAALAQSTSAYDFALRGRHIAGVAASCLVTTLKPDHPADPSLGVSGSLCIAPSGAILAIDSPTNAVTAVQYSNGVASDAFDLPAKVSRS